MSDYFRDTEKFTPSVDILTRQVGFDLLDEEKSFCLKKHIITLRKGKTDKKTKRGNHASLGGSI